jgi:hypothetical protein
VPYEIYLFEVLPVLETIIRSMHRTYSGNEIRPSLFVSNSKKNSDGEHRSSPGFRSPLKRPSLTMSDSDGGNTGTIARIRSAGSMNTSPSEFRTDAKYSNI